LISLTHHPKRNMGKYVEESSSHSVRAHEISSSQDTDIVDKKITVSRDTWRSIKDDISSSEYSREESRSDGKVARTLHVSQDKWEDIKDDHGLRRN
jgi:hypothetical protein